MPTIAIFEGIKVCIYADDHLPPHIHILFAEHEAAIRISDLGVMAGSLPRPVLNKVLAWAADNQAQLALRWIQLNEDRS